MRPVHGTCKCPEERHAALVLDVNSGAILHDEDADELRHPASLTKMMTLYLTFETLESGRLKMSDKFTISKAAASVAPSKLDLDPGEQISVSDAIYAVVTKSANDIAVALAEKIGGTEANFVRLMNTRAREIGMTKTHFENPSGLPNDDHVSTARDMATLALHLMDDYPDLLSPIRNARFQVPGQELPQSQHDAEHFCRRRRHQDRLHPCIRVQPRDVRAPRQTTPDRRRFRRLQRRIAQR